MIDNYRCILYIRLYIGIYNAVAAIDSEKGDWRGARRRGINKLHLYKMERKGGSSRRAVCVETGVRRGLTGEEGKGEEGKGNERSRGRHKTRRC